LCVSRELVIRSVTVAWLTLTAGLMVIPNQIIPANINKDRKSRQPRSQIILNLLRFVFPRYSSPLRGEVGRG